MPKIKSLDFILHTLDISKDELQQLDFASGQIIADRYEVVELLGAGGMGAVYLVKDMILDNDLKALKIMLPNLLNNENARKRFHKEILISQKLNHPNILRVFDYMTAGDIEFFTMEYVDGINMREWLDQEHHQGHIALPKLVPLITEVLMGLSSAHQITVHRDIKPENILLPKPPSQIKAKICDFGLAQLQKQGWAVHTSHIMGTLNYMAPEQQNPKANVDQRADLYAVGVIFYEALTQEKPAGLFKLPCALREDLPSQVDDFVQKALNQKPVDRFRDASEMLQALDQLTSKVSQLKECRVEEPSAALSGGSSLEQKFAANLKRLKNSGAIRAYVWQHQGTWSEEEWEKWAHELQLQGYYPLDEDALGKELEQEQAALEKIKPEVASKKRMIVSLEKGFCYQDGLNLVAELAKRGLKDAELAEFSTRLEQKQHDLSKNRDQGMKMWQKRDVNAIVHLERALALNPLDKDVKTALEAARQEDNLQRKQRYAELLRTGDDLVSKGQLTQAIAIWESALGLVSDEDEVRAKIEKTRRKHQEILDLLRQAQEKADPFQQKTLMEKVLAINPSDQDTSALLVKTKQEIANRYQQYDDILKKGKSLQQQGKLSEAISVLNQGIGLVPEEHVLQQNLHTLKVQEEQQEQQQEQIKKLMQTAQEKDNLFDQQSLLKEALDIKPANKDLLAMLAEVEEKIASKRFHVFADNVIKDTTTGLEWCVGPDKDTSHYEAEKWVANLSVAGGGWRMPTIDELRKLYQQGKGTRNMDPVFTTSGWAVWSSELLDKDNELSQNRNSPRARGFTFDGGLDSWLGRGSSGNGRVFAVRRRRR